ncbi:PAS domain S-box-containing protein/diguanylate cyclase (GGDEF) domain-containing protein [Duganella sp. CF458]|uniref:EAL domain-containing protein n=1 Tax=Duganella sp. CF458 TaxID=1884368 RepID=UPI0008E59431|nr:EAL domain-containing protein [Duganella sp. CF458]SFG93929.1 PAS domain S-box-containing protein/diguanylate cyclase (GGDEF) domain-containing protein [Duganella sp. CF458]
MFDYLILVLGAPDSSVLYLGHYDPVLVILSVAVAIFASYAALLVAQLLPSAASPARRAGWLAAGGGCLGLGIWAMHFVGMLAFTLPCTNSYDAGLTLLSTVPGMLASGLALHVISQGPPNTPRLWIAGTLLGAGIGAMHYTGMAAMQFDGMIKYDLRLFLLSIAVAVAMATLALWLKFRLARLKGRWASPLWSSVVMGLAVACMHYTAMAAAYFVRDNRGGNAAANAAESAHISPSILAASVLVFTSLLIVVTIVATYVGKRRLFTFERSYRLVATLIIGWSLIAWLGASYLQHRMSEDLYQHELQVAQVQADNVASSIEESTARLRGFALMLARDAGIRSIAIQGAADQSSNERLAQTARALKVDSMFVLDANGTCIATSNLAEADFYVGRNFANRDYYIQSHASEEGQQYGVGRDGLSGALYYAHAVRDGGRFLGVAVVKLNAGALAAMAGPSQAWVSDPNGVIIHSANAALRHQALPSARVNRLDPGQRRQRYGRETFASIALEPWDAAMPAVSRIANARVPSVLATRPLSDGSLSVTVPRPLPALLHQGTRRFWLFMLIEFAGSMLVAAATATALYLREKQKADADLRVAATAFESLEGMAITDADHMILRVNRAYTDITGFSERDALDRELLVCDEPALQQRIWDGVAAHGAWQGEVWQLRKGGARFPCWLVVTAVRDAAGEITHHVCALTDITERKASEQEIRNLALFDFLTQLPNRRCLMDRLQHALASSARTGQCGALLFIDLDNFKDLNDTLGHNVGDMLLQQAARRFVGCVRESDTVARLGGDEFVIMLENLSDDTELAAEQARAIGAKLLARQNEPYVMGPHQHSCTSSVGITVFRGEQESLEDLLKQTDLAMYQAKAAGRNTMCFFDPAMQTVVSARAALDADLRQGLSLQQFILHYQPQVDAEGRITGAEALLRWQHPIRGLVPPMQFIAAAEASSLILPLGGWVLEQACTQLVAWSRHPATAALELAVNVSPRQFYQADFVEQVMGALLRSGASPRLLKLELTEGLLLDDVEASIGKMALLKAAGIGISLDDFGTGYSSLAYLKRLPLCQLKIDRSFVRDILHNADDAAITKTILTLADSMGLSAIAEGVESLEQKNYLARQGCRAFQGYLFGTPLPVADFEALLLPEQLVSA